MIQNFCVHMKDYLGIQTLNNESIQTCSTYMKNLFFHSYKCLNIFTLVLNMCIIWIFKIIFYNYSIFLETHVYFTLKTSFSSSKNFSLKWVQK